MQKRVDPPSTHRSVRRFRIFFSGVFGNTVLTVSATAERIISAISTHLRISEPTGEITPAHSSEARLISTQPTHHSGTATQARTASGMRKISSRVLARTPPFFFSSSSSATVSSPPSPSSGSAWASSTSTIGAGAGAISSFFRISAGASKAPPISTPAAAIVAAVATVPLFLSLSRLGFSMRFNLFYQKISIL